MKALLDLSRTESVRKIMPSYSLLVFDFFVKFVGPVQCFSSLKRSPCASHFSGYHCAVTSR